MNPFVVAICAFLIAICTGAIIFTTFAAREEKKRVEFWKQQTEQIRERHQREHEELDELTERIKKEIGK